jgi:hypothetical protein
MLLVAAKDRTGGFSAVQPYGVQPSGSQINAWMSDSGAIPIDDCGEFLASPQGVSVPRVTIQQHRSADWMLGLGHPPLDRIQQWRGC